MKFGWGVWRWVGVGALGCLTLVGSAGGQVLARKNWEGSGVTVEAWWARGVFCAGGAKRLLGGMDGLAGLGCDAVEVEAPAVGGDREDARAASEVEALIDEASRRKVRVVLDVRVGLGGGGASSVEQGLVEQARFWSQRGVAGFVLKEDGGSAGDGVGRRMVGALGSRVMIAEEFGARQGLARTGGAGLAVRRISWGNDTAGLRAGLSQTLGDHRGAGLMLAGDGLRFRQAEAALLLLTGTGARVEVGAALPGEVVDRGEARFSAEEMLLWVPKGEGERAGAAMGEWYRQVAGLRRESASLRTGRAEFLDFDTVGALAWVVPGRDGRALLVVCNLSGQGVTVAVEGAVRRVGVRGSSLNTLLRSDGVMGRAAALGGIDMGVDGVFVGEIR